MPELHSHVLCSAADFVGKKHPAVLWLIQF